VTKPRTLLILYPGTVGVVTTMKLLLLKLITSSSMLGRKDNKTSGIHPIVIVQITAKVTGPCETACSSSFATEAKEVTGKKTMTPITDGLAYNDAYKKELWTLKGLRTEHVRHIKLKGDRDNNKMERLNGEIRDGEKVMRGLKKDDTPILKGYRIFHNYIRTHEGLKVRLQQKLAE